MTRQIETTVANPDYKLFINTVTGQYGYSINADPIVWCNTRQEAESKG